MAAILAGGLLVVSACSGGDADARASAQPRETSLPVLDSVRFRAEVDSAGGASVQVLQALRLEPGTRHVELRGLRVGGRNIRRLQAHAGSESLTVGPTEDTGRQERSETLVARRVKFPPGAGESGRLTLRVTYGVARALRRRDDGADIQIPLVLADAPAADARADFFRGDVRLPADLEVLERFPTVPWEPEDDEAGTTYRFQLQAVPSLLRVRGRFGKGSWLTMGRILDIAVITFLAGLLPLGWWITRRT